MCKLIENKYKHDVCLYCIFVSVIYSFRKLMFNSIEYHSYNLEINPIKLKCRSQLSIHYQIPQTSCLYTLLRNSCDLLPHSLLICWCLDRTCVVHLSNQVHLLNQLISKIYVNESVRLSQWCHLKCKNKFGQQGKAISSNIEHITKRSSAQHVLVCCCFFFNADLDWDWMFYCEVSRFIFIKRWKAICNLNGWAAVKMA